MTWQTHTWSVLGALDRSPERAQGKGSGTVLKMGLPPNPVPASLRLRRQLRPVVGFGLVGFGLVGMDGCFRIVGFAGWFWLTEASLVADFGLWLK